MDIDMIRKISAPVTYERRRAAVSRNKLLQEEVNLQNLDDLELTIQLLKKNERSKVELNYLMKAFKNLKFFEDQRVQLPEILFVSLFKEVQYQQIKQDNSVFSYGEMGHTYYIILRGRVSILLPKPKVVEELQQNKLTFDQLNGQIDQNKLQFANKMKRKSMKQNSEYLTGIMKRLTVQSNSLQSLQRQFYSRASMVETHVNMRLSLQGPKSLAQIDSHNDSYDNDNDDNDNDNDNEAQFDQHFFDEYLNTVYCDFHRLKTLVPGDAFGEIALITKSNRTATIVCESDCDFATLTKGSFDQILGEQHNMIMQRKVEFFKHFPFFWKVPNSRLISLIHQMILINPKLQECVFKEGQSADTVYFLLSGEVEISQLVELKSKSELGAMTTVGTEIKQVAVNRKQVKRVLMSTLTEGTVFGQEDVINNTTRTVKAVSKSHNTQLYTLSATQFLGVLKSYSMQNTCHSYTSKLSHLRDQRVHTSKVATEQIIKQQLATSSSSVALIHHCDNNNNNNNNNNNAIQPTKANHNHTQRLKIVNDISIMESSKQTVYHKIFSTSSYKPLSTDNCLIPINPPKHHYSKQTHLTTSSSYKRDPNYRNHYLSRAALKLSQFLLTSEEKTILYNERIADQFLKQNTNNNNNMLSTYSLTSSSKINDTLVNNKQFNNSNSSINMHVINLKKKRLSKRPFQSMPSAYNSN